MFRCFSRVAVLAASLPATAFAQDLVINFDDLNPAPKQAFEEAVAKFREANPDLDIEVNNNDREAHKTAIRNFLTADPPDVTSWYPGNRMAPFVNAGLFEDISDLWAAEGLSDSMAASEATMTLDGKQWGVPYSYYQWGIYYRTDLFEEHGIEVPENWDALLAACATLQEAGITPFAIGTSALWPAAGWFDYLSLRTNGYDVHMQLTNGEIAYTDERVVQVFEHWKELVEPGYFLANHATMDWQDAVAPFANGEAAMYLMGNFAVDAMLQAGLSEDQLGYFAFPTIDPDVPRAEDAPTDAFFIPSGAKNKENGRKFLAFVAQPDVQTAWNRTMLQLPPNSEASVGDNKFLQAGFEVLSGADALAQFYDRDAPPQMADAGMNGFQEFMVKPDRLDRILQRLDQVQSRVYK